MNAHYIRSLPKREIVDRAREFLRRAGYDVDARDPAWLEGIIGLRIERAKYLRDFAENLGYFFHPPAEYEPKGVKKFFLQKGISELLQMVATRIERAEPFSIQALEEPMRAACEESGMEFGALAQPARLALTGTTATPGLFEVMFYIGREECARRLRTAAQAIAEGRFGAPAS